MQDDHIPYEWMRPMTEAELWQEHCDYEANAEYDYRRELYSALDAEHEFACDEAASREEFEAFIGPHLPLDHPLNDFIPF